MATEIILPRVDMDMSSGKIGRWLVKPGDKVEKGTVLFEIETDKAAMEIEAEDSGIIDHFQAEEGVDIPVGQVVAWLYKDGEERKPPAATETATAPAAAREAAAPASEPEEAPVAAARVADGLRATPLARNLARQGHVDLTQVAGSGPDGRIQAADIKTSGNAAPSALFTQWRGAKSGPVLVMLHGFAADCEGWSPVLRLIESKARVLLLDLPAHGRSANVTVQDFSAMADAVVHALRQQIKEPFHLLGHSLGGAIATAVAEAMGAAVASLTLLNPAGLGPEINGAFVRGIAQAREMASLKAWLKLLVADPARINDSYVRAAFKSREEADAHGAQAALARVLFADDTQTMDVSRLLKGLKCPVRVMVGLEDAIIPPSYALHLAGAIALHRLPSIGHLPHLEAPELVAELVMQNMRSAG